MRIRIPLVLFFVGVLLNPGVSFGQDPDRVLTNADFELWHNDHPVGWHIEIGASNGANSPKSIVRKGDGPSLELSGDSQTLAWQLVRQPIRVNAGDTLRLTFHAKVSGLKREGRQFDNCHVGLWPKDTAGKGIGSDIQSVSSAEYSRHSVVARIPDNAVTSDVTIFLSKTGTLNVKDMHLTKFAPNESFDLLIQELSDKYSYFETKSIDLSSLQKKYRPLAEAAASKTEFADVVGDMFAEFRDPHTWVTLDGRRINKFESTFTANYNFSAIDADLKDVKRIGIQNRSGVLGVVGKTSQGFGYVRISTLSGVSSEQIKELMTAIRELFDVPGIIVDLRRNNGGTEGIGQAVASMFSDKEHVYARQKFRSGTGFVETPPRTIQPGRQPIYRKPIVCLCGPGAVSSAEGFVLMMKAIEHCTVIGQPTRGASGNPQPVPMPNGVDAWFSRWQSLNPDGTVIEDVGVQPDILVTHDVSESADPTFARAIEILSAD